MKSGGPIMKIHIVFALIALVALAGCIIEEPFYENTNDTKVEDTKADDTKETTKDAITAEEPPQEPVKATAANPEPQRKDGLPVKNVREGELVSFPNLKAVDPDGDPITYTFTSPLDKEGTWQTEVGDAGEYKTTITASDGTNTASQEVLIIVSPANSPPQISINAKLTFKEGETVTLAPEVTDADGDNVTVAYFGWMNSATKQASYDDSGTYKVVVEADDGKEKVKKEITIVIENVNRKPEFEELEPMTVKEGKEVEVRPKAKDLDGDSVTFKFAEPLDSSGNWRTKVGDAGEYSVLIVASDGKSQVEQRQLITVQALNEAPIIKIDDQINIKEGELLKLKPAITDPEGDEFTVSYTGWMSSDTKQLTYEDAGRHIVTITAEDTGGHKRTKEVTIAVADVNRPPVFGEGAFI